jgi:hypothetical protein
MNKWLKDNVVSSLTLVAIIGAAVYYGEVKELMFPDVTTKVRTIDHTNNAKSEQELYQTLKVLDTVADFAKKDSRENLKRDSIRDDMVQRNTVTIFQIKQKQDTILKKLDQYIKIHD